MLVRYAEMVVADSGAWSRITCTARPPVPHRTPARQICSRPARFLTRSPGQGGAQPGGVGLGLGVVGVLGARPEEPAQPVPLGPRHDVQVQVRDRLADGVV